MWNLGNHCQAMQRRRFQITVFLHKINLLGLGVKRHIGDILSRVVGPHLKKGLIHNTHINTESVTVVLKLGEYF